MTINTAIRYLEKHIDALEICIERNMGVFKSSLERDPYDAFYCSGALQEDLAYREASKRVLAACSDTDDVSAIKEIIQKEIDRINTNVGHRKIIGSTPGVIMQSNAMVGLQFILTAIDDSINSSLSSA